MYKIDKKPWGYVLTFSGKINPDEMQRWSDDSKRHLEAETNPSFGVIIDMKDLEPLTGPTRDIMIKGQKAYKVRGMKRSAVILNSAEICAQFKNLAIQSGIYATERYIDASKNANAIEIAVNWIKNSVNPDK